MPSSVESEGAPNLLFLWTDQHAAPTMGAYGNGSIETPNLDGLAEDGVVFDRAYCSQPVCTPARSTIMTGLYPHATGCTENNVRLPSHVPCFPELGDFDEYTTAFMGKWHLGDEVFAQHGFDEWVSIDDMYRSYYGPDRDREHSTYFRFLTENGFEPDVEDDDGFERFSREFCAGLPERYSKPAYLAREARRFIREHRDEPFILHVCFLEPHFPNTSPRDDQYSPGEVSFPPNFEHEGFDDQPLRVRLIRESYRQGLDIDGKFWMAETSEAEWRGAISRYWGLVSLVDTHVGTILETLADCGLEDETITVYTSDHGEMMGSHQLLNKLTMFEESVRVPLIVRLPGSSSPGRVDRPVGQVDLVPTLLDAMGQPRPDHLHGESLLPLLDDETDVPDRNVYIEWSGPCTGAEGWVRGGSVRPRVDPEYLSVWEEMATEDEIVEVMTAPIRTVITPDGLKLNFRRGDTTELYDLDSDPHETTNLARDPDHADTVAELKGEIFDWQVRTNDTAYFV